MSKGTRLRLLIQADVFVSKMNREAFIESGNTTEVVHKIPYDPEAVKAMVQSGMVS